MADKERKLNNPIYLLSEHQTAELKTLWGNIKQSVENKKHNFVWVKLSAARARLSRKQLWMISSELANFSCQPIPLFVYEYLEGLESLEGVNTNDP